ncbi:hypothetical protein [Lysobacter capsici]|uniref:hypothetical protein n=1 Tax=Lysobacter capsici TaxID=435897 RepID=UPI000BBAAAF9|nr:hypothetical protein [Lysobacter capsici]ATE73740.1 hypothetical protein CNO08_21660 [Lysobacter capsici]
MNILSSDATASGAEPDWDALIDNPYDIGRLERLVRADRWWVVTGMRVDLGEAVTRAQNRGRAEEAFEVNKLLVFADTVDVRHTPEVPILCGDFSRVIVIARHLETNEKLQLEKRGWDVEFYLGFYVCGFSPVLKTKTLLRWMFWTDPNRGRQDIRTTHDLPDPLTRTQLMVTTMGLHDPLPFTEHPLFVLLLPLEACTPLLERMLFAAQQLAAEGKGELAVELLARLEQLLDRSPDRPAWQTVALGCRAAQELLRPVRFDPGQVPYLSAAFYGELAKEHIPTLQAYAGTFARLSDRAYDLDARKKAARLVLGEKDDQGAFQKLVAEQLAENFRIATANVTRAQNSIGPQSDQVKRAEAGFKAGLAAWEEAKKREMAMAIVGSVFSFVSGVASMFSGNASGAAGAAKAAADVASTAAKLAEIMSKLVQVGKAIEKIVRLCLDIVAATDKLDNAKSFADAMAAITRGSLSDDAKGAPSANAYWDQLWVEVETQLAPAIDQKIDGANEYLKELKILVIYGRALTAAQIALPPLIQEMARAKLQAEIARRQHDAVLAEINALTAQKALSGQAMVVLWGNYRKVQRSMLVALQQFDAAYRYWALTDERAPRDNLRGIADLAGDLAEIADLKKMQGRALDSFRPPPQPFVQIKHIVAAAAREALLKGERVAIALTPSNGPLSGWGRVSRARVGEIFVWVDWVEGKRPKSGAVEFTVRTSGVYDDTRLIGAQSKLFHFQGAPVDLSFRYDLAASPHDQPSCIRARAAIAEDFRTSYSEPTLSTDWIISSPKVSAGDSETVDLTQLKSAIAGIRLEFSGSYIKDPDRMF